jgi:hypothetical protein
MIVVDTTDVVVGSGELIERVDAQGETNLIKVVVDTDTPTHYFYIGTDDRDLYIIYENTSVPDPTKLWKFFVLPDGTYEYEDITPPPSFP